MGNIIRIHNSSNIDEIIALSYECLKLNYPPSLIKYCASMCLKIRSQSRKKKYESELCAFTHNFSIQGAPYALLNYLKSPIFSSRLSTIISPIHGELASDFSCITEHLLIHSFLKNYSPTSLESLDSCIDKIIILISHISPRHLFINTTRGWMVALACRKLDINYTWWIHEAEAPFEFISNQSVREQAITTFKTSHRLLFASNATKIRYLDSIQLTNQASSAKVLYPGITRDIFSEFKHKPENINSRKNASRDNIGISYQKICILSIGTFCLRKNQLELLDAMMRVEYHKLEKIKLLMIGSSLEEPSYSLEMKKKAKILNSRSRNCDVVELLPPTLDVLDYFIAADYYIHTSTFECFSQTVNEAKSMCLRIIVRNCEGMEEVLAGYSHASIYTSFLELVRYLQQICG